MITTILPAIAALMVLSANSGQAQAPTGPPDGGPPRPESPPAGTTIHRDLSYVTNGHPHQKLDLYLPAGAQRPPLIIMVHGGAFMYGDRTGEDVAKFVKAGYAVASVDYRLSGDARFPAAVEDCKAAVRWLRANAARYGYDPERFAAYGESAGGNLVAILGTTGDVKTFDVGENLDVSSRVQAVVDYFGPTDFLQMDAHAPPGSDVHSAPDSPESKYIGGNIADHPDLVKAANPITYISRNTPPFFIAHGEQDHVVAFYQSELLVAALKQRGIAMTFMPVKGADHGFHGATAAQTQALHAATEAFLKRVFAINKSSTPR